MTYQCDFGYLPTLARNSTCVFNNDSMSYAWVPALEEHLCLLRAAGDPGSITLLRLDTIVGPGMIFTTIIYNCSITSTGESLQLTWRVTFPGDLAPTNITYDGNSVPNRVDNLLGSVSSTLVEYRSNQYIESTITFTLITTGIPSEIELECRIGNLESVVEPFLSHITGKTQTGEVTLSGP